MVKHTVPVYNISFEYLNPFELLIIEHPELYREDIDARKLYGSLCNIIWKKEDQEYSCSWRYAGGFIADIRNALLGLKEDYLDYYCSGNEEIIDNRLEKVATKEGWTPIKTGKF